MKQKVALALGSGGARGLAHIGVIEELEKHGFEITSVSGSFYTAARASIAIPAVFTPLAAGDMLFVDGGVLNPVPVNHVKRTEGDILVAVNLYEFSWNL